MAWDNIFNLAVISVSMEGSGLFTVAWQKGRGVRVFKACDLGAERNYKSYPYVLSPRVFHLAHGRAGAIPPVPGIIQLHYFSNFMTIF